MALNLTALGAELDAIRRQRAPSSSSVDTASSGTSPRTPPLLAAALPLIADELEPVSTPKPDAPEAMQEDRAEQPFALCLLCFARPPSAVLLPCCHLNLCYLCAPLLIARSQPACPFPAADAADAADAEDAEPRTDRVPFNVALARALRKAPEKRRLGAAGFVPPARGQSGAEVAGSDVLAGPGPMRSHAARDGQVRLEAHSGERRHGGTQTQCLVCRTGVEGWLRVYTG